MRRKIPVSPLATRFSGPARETEARLRSLFRFKRNPPAALVVLTLAAALFCGGLVSCQSGEGEFDPVVITTGGDTSEPAGNVSAPTENETLPEEAEWLAAELDAGLLQYNVHIRDEPFFRLTPEEAALLTQNLPVDELPREAVEIFHALRRDYWRDLLLPVAADGEHDVTVYFVAVPDALSDMEPGASPAGFALNGSGVVLRYGDRAACFPLSWHTNAKFGSNPSLLVDDLDGDELPEAALALAYGDGTGCYVEDLYIFDLEAMSYTLPDYSRIPLEIFCNSDRTIARLVSGDREHTVRLDELRAPFEGVAEAGNQVDFDMRDGQIFCRLELDFSCNTLGYLAYADFSVVYEDGAYRLGPAAELGELS